MRRHAQRLCSVGPVLLLLLVVALLAPVPTTEARGACVVGVRFARGLLGRPGRITALQRFLDHIESHDHVWVARRLDIARHWTTTHPA